MPTGLLVLMVVLVVAAALAIVFRAVNGRFRGRSAGQVLTAADIGAPLGSRLTLVQFSSAFCAPCRATRVLLQDVTTSLDDVEHIEIDAESNLDLVRALNIVRTPTVVVLDAAGNVIQQASGLPRRDQVEAVLQRS